jgi:outer membrane protein assembly factor BamB
VFFHDGESVVCLDRHTGKERWRSDPIPRSEIIPSFYVPILVAYEGVILFSGGQTAGTQTGSWYMSGEDTMTALSLETGKVLWTAYHPPSGYRSPEDLLVANGLVWTGETTSGRAVGVFVGRDPYTGEVKSEFPPDVETYWFHHRCYRGKATDRYLIMSRTGTEFIDLESKKWLLNHWVRGACLYGVMPANGLLYAPHHPCACYLETKLSGFCALAPAAAGPGTESPALGDERFERGPAYGALLGREPVEGQPGDWPTFRHDSTRSGCTNSAVPSKLKEGWRETLGGRLTQPVVVAGRLFVASVDSHTLYALEANTGKRLWQYTAGGRIDSPPTIHDGGVYFGSADGSVYCLRDSDGALAWCFRAAPVDRRHAAFEQLESVWPVHGSVLVRDGPSTSSGHAELWCVAGRSMFLDGGLHLWRLEPKTGRVLSKTVMDGHDPDEGESLQDYVSWLNMPPGLPDILSTDGRLVYMRSQPFNPDGTRPPLKPMLRGKDADRGAPEPTQDPEVSHLFCPTGFLDDTWWHRTYWLYGSQFISGWAGYYLAGKASPAGRILVFDDSKVYGFGRKPQYYRWTTPIEHQLFAADKITQSGDRSGSLILVDKSASLNPAGTALTVEALVKAVGSGGVILANGGNIHGYALFLQDGRPHFAVRIGGELVTVGAKEELADTWIHLAGVLTAGKEIELYVDGKLAGSAGAPGFIETAPTEVLSVGVDEKSCVGNYASPFAFKGLIDEIRIYHRGLTHAEISNHAGKGEQAVVKPEGLVLWYAFEQGGARDASGNNNHGKTEGIAQVEGKVGRAVRFTGKGRPSDDYKVQHDWTMNLPLLARSLCHAGELLYVAGPHDLIDEDQVFDQIDDPKIMRSLVEQAASINGQRGGLLLAVSAVDGEETARYDLASPPVFDGMIAANEKLYMSTMDGSVVCFK